MNINDLVPDLKICQEAKEKGVVIESAFKYFKFSLNKDYLLQFDPTNDFMTLSGELEDKVSAPLTDDILKMLPWTIEMNGLPLYLTIQMQREVYCVGYERRAVYDNNYHFVDKKLSNALLLLATKLMEEGIIKI